MRLALISLLLAPLGILAALQHTNSTTSSTHRRSRRFGCNGKGRGEGGGGRASWARPSTGAVNNAYVVEDNKAEPQPEVVNGVMRKVVIVTVTEGVEAVQTPVKPKPTTKPPPTPQKAVIPVAPKAPESKPSPNPAPAPEQPKPQAQTGSGGGGMTKEDWIAAHTNARAKYGSGPVTWSDGAAAQAQANVAAHQGSCDLSPASHTKDGKFGENLMAGGGGNGVAIANDIVGGWVEEVKDYNYDNPGFGMNTGHFTAVVWKSVKSIGCAVGKCGAEGTWVACCYDPFPNDLSKFADQVPRPL